MTLTGRIFLAWELFIVQVKVVGSLSVLSDTRADFLHFPWRSLQNLPELTKCPVVVVFAGVGSICWYSGSIPMTLDLTRSDCRTLEHLVGPAIH